MTTTDFDQWMEDNVEGIEDAFCLEQAIRNQEHVGSFDVKVKGDRLFVEAFGDTLMIAGAKAQETFLSMLENKYSDEGLSIESTYDFKRQMEKND